MEIEKILVLNISHLKDNTRIFLTESGEDEDKLLFRFIPYKNHKYGFVFFVSGGLSENDFKHLESYLKDNNIEDLFPVFKEAVKRNCFMINYDSDAPISKKFETYKSEFFN